MKILMKQKDESVSAKKGIILKQTGSKISADIIHLQQQTGIRVNNRSPFIIQASGVDPLTAEKKIFNSTWIWTDVFVEVQNHKTIDVYIDSQNPSKYYMDLSSIGINE